MGDRALMDVLFLAQFQPSSTLNEWRDVYRMARWSTPYYRPLRRLRFWFLDRALDESLWFGAADGRRR